jgi:uncharacterized protein
MTASISASVWAASYRVPGVYQAPMPRAPDVLPARTDVAGFIGFEPRVRDSVPPSQLLGGASPTGHSFFVDVNGFTIRRGLLRTTVPATPRLLLSQGPATMPVLDGQSIVYAIAVGDQSRTGNLIVLAGAAAVSGTETAPADDAVRAAVSSYFQSAGDSASVAVARHWTRLADVTVRRVGTTVLLTVHPYLRITRCDDWNDFVSFFDTPVDDGTFLGPAVRAFFANGGARCYVCTVSRPDFSDPVGVALAGQEMVGVQGSSEAAATGLERLLLVDEVSIIDVPDLYARASNPQTQTYQLPPPAQDACFIPCQGFLPAPTVTTVTGTGADGDPLFPANLFTTDPYSDPFLSIQLQLIARCIPERWRSMLLLAPPLVLDGGNYVAPAPPDAIRWRGIFDNQQKTSDLGDTYDLSCTALYFPWLIIQEVVGDPVYPMPPTPLAAGIIAKRDLARGPQFAPANETLLTVVGVTTPIDDDTNAQLYSPPPDANGLGVPAVNVIRPFAGYGVQLWGARTLSTDPWMQFINVRRAVSAIERQCKAVLDTLVFEPNTPFLWVQVTQSVLGVLMPMFDSGGLRGDTPAQAFYVRCDSTVNTPDLIAQGILICEVGVAVAAPAEFIVFRIGRKEGVAEVFE